MAASLVCGIETNADAIGWLISLGDMLTVPTQVIGQVRDVISHGRSIKTLAAPFTMV